MKHCKTCAITADWNTYDCPICLGRLEGVPGPEQGLVGESRSARKQGHAEEAKPGERGVGEIAERFELLRHIERTISEARALEVEYTEMENHDKACFEHGKVVALLNLSHWLSATAEKRSDLSNA